jgi:hypothetical protein
MTLPVIESVTTSVVVGDTTFTLNMPATKPDGDLYVAIVGKDDDPSFTAHSSWTNEVYNNETGGAQGPRGGVWWRIGSNESASYDWTGDNEEWAGIVLRISGFSLNNVLDSVVTSVGETGAPVHPDATPTYSDSLILRVAAIDTDEFGAGYYPGTQTEITTQSSSAGGAGSAAIAATYITSPPVGGSSTGTSAFTGGADDSWVAATVVFNAETVPTGQTFQKTLADTATFAENQARGFWGDRAQSDSVILAENQLRDAWNVRAQTDTATFAEDLSPAVTQDIPFVIPAYYITTVRIKTGPS